MNYEKDLEIDLLNLEKEWVRQASLAMRYRKAFAKAKKAYQEAHERVKVIRSELIRKANLDPTTCCGKARPNAADIEAFYRNHTAHKEAKQELIEAEYELNLTEGAKDEIAYTRKKALENEVNLHAQQYFAGPKVPNNPELEKEVRKGKKERVLKGTAKGMRRKRKK